MGVGVVVRLGSGGLVWWRVPASLLTAGLRLLKFLVPFPDGGRAGGE